jgi:hypothetical protein
MNPTIAYQILRTLDRAVLEEMMLACAEGHVALCSITSQETDPHATVEVMRERISKMSGDEVARGLSGFAALGGLVHEHHPGHGEHEEHTG